MVTHLADSDRPTPGGDTSTEATAKPTPAPHTPRKASYGLKEMISQGLGGTIGGPIFVILGYALSVAQTGILVSFAVNGLLMLGFILIFSELALSLPISGGGYSFSKEAIGGAQGFLIGWLIWVGNILFIAISGLGFSFSLIVFLPDRWIGADTSKAIGFGIILVFFLLNLFYPRFVKRLLRIMTYSIVAGFTVYVILGLAVGSSKNPDFSTKAFSEPFKFSGMLSMTAYTFIIYCVYEWNSAFESMTASFDNIKRPRKTIPRAFILSMLTAIVIYWSVTLVTLLNIGSWSSNTAAIVLASDAPLADVFGVMLQNHVGVYFMGIIGMIATNTSINSGLQMASHVLHSMSRDGFMPKIFEKTRGSVQWIALSISAALGLVVTLVLDVDVITEVSNFIFLISMIFLSLSLIILRKTRPNLIRPWKAPFFPALPITAIIASGTLISTMFISPLGLYGIVFGAVIVLFGGIYYLFQISRRDRILLILYGAKLGAALLFMLAFFLLQTDFLGTQGQVFPAMATLFLVFLAVGTFSSLFDIVSIRRWFLLFTRRRGETVVVSGITQLNNISERWAHWLGLIVNIGQLVVGAFFAVFGILVYARAIVPQSVRFPGEFPFMQALFLTFSLLVGALFVLTGLVRLMLENEYLKIGTSGTQS